LLTTAISDDGAEKPIQALISFTQAAVSTDDAVDSPMNCGRRMRYAQRCPVRLRDLNTAERVLRQMQINLAKIVREQTAYRKDQFFSK
jgi:hypothetical protein